MNHVVSDAFDGLFFGARACCANTLFLDRPMPPLQLAVVLIGFAVPIFPSVKFAAAKLKPSEQLLDRGATAFLPVVDIIDDGIACIMGDPLFFQRSPLSFFALTFASINSAITSLRSLSFSSS